MRLQMGSMEEISVVLRRFGDEQSTLFDQFERLSFEVQLNRAILGRSLSEPSRARSIAPPVAPRTALVSQVRQGCRASRFEKILKKLLKPILCRKRGRREVADPKDPKSWKAFSRSLRV